MRYRNGQTAMIFLLIMVGLLGAIALCADVGTMYYCSMRMQKAADASALAGANYLIDHAPALPTIPGGCPAGGDDAENVACAYSVLNGENVAEVTATDPAPGAPGGLPSGAKTIEVDLVRNDIPNFFGRFVNRGNPYSAKVRAIALAASPVESIKDGLLPIGMPPNPNGVPLVYGASVTLGEGVASGDWEFLNIPLGCSGTGCASTGGGAPLLATNLTNGCDCEVAVGDSLYPKSGIAWGQVNTALATRVPVQNTPLPAELTGSEPNLVTVPVTNWTGAQGSSTPVAISGFAEVWLSAYKKTGSTITITATFVKYISKFGTAGGGSDYGAYMPPSLVR